MKIKCAHCGKTAEKAPNEVNRAQRAGLRMFCNRRCAGFGRRKHKTKTQRVEEKRIYDAAYRAKNLAMLKAKKRAYHKRTYDPAKARIERRKNMARHVQYCRRPEYKAWKREYDRRHRASEFGPFAEAYMLTIDLNREIKGRMTNHEIKWENGTSNKAQFRRRSGKEKERARPRTRDRRRDHPSAVGQ